MEAHSIHKQERVQEEIDVMTRIEKGNYVMSLVEHVFIPDDNIYFLVMELASESLHQRVLKMMKQQRGMEKEEFFTIII
jgi:hypothetical protein